MNQATNLQRESKCKICGEVFQYSPFFTIAGKELKRHMCDACKADRAAFGADTTMTGVCECCGQEFTYKQVAERRLKHHTCDACKKFKSERRAFKEPFILETDGRKYVSDLDVCVACVDWLQQNGEPNMSYGDFVARYDTQTKRIKFALDHDIRRKDGRRWKRKRLLANG